MLPSNVNVRYLYQPGELEGGEHRRATDPIWSLDMYQIGSVIDRKPILCYLASGPKRAFVRQELLVVPSDTQLPPVGVSPTPQCRGKPPYPRLRGLPTGIL